MCEKCNTPQRKFVDKTIETKEYDSIIFIGNKQLITSSVIEQNSLTIQTKGNADYKTAQMLSNAFNINPGLLQLFRMAEELMPIMKTSTH